VTLDEPEVALASSIDSVDNVDNVDNVNLVEINDENVPLADKLPQTGQLWWPIPMLLAFGMLFILTGILRRRNMNEK
jgi:LPXTG-motif cell wall-anchored protein